MRKQAKKKRQKKASKPRKLRMPKLPLAKLAALPVAFLVVFLSYELSTALLDRPIRTIRIEGPFERVSALEIEAAIGDELERGFFSASLAEIQDRVVALSWIDKANVVRRWPDTVEISVMEQIPAAAWGERGLMNTRGELFVAKARHVPAELPRLSGPEGSAPEVARRYLAIRKHLIPLGLDLRRLHMDARGAWDLTLSNGVQVRLGRRDTDERTDLFLDVVANIVSSREADIEFVDMRYSNGFTIGWEEDAGAERPAYEFPESGRPEMVAERAVR